jgi:hypothetical protein
MAKDARMRNAAIEPTRRGHLLGPVIAGLASYLALIRPRLRSWGATSSELRASYPGDELIPEGRIASTMATTIAAPPSAVWPWLVQMGGDRAGFYSFDHLDNGGRPSAERIHPEWQDLTEGGRVLGLPDGSVWFDVARLVPKRTLILRSSLSLPRAQHFDPSAPPPRAFSDSTWAFHLSPAGEDGTRLVIRAVARGRPKILGRLADLLFWEPAHWVMQSRQFKGLRRRAEGTLQSAGAS